jgi:hypothetical protein
VKTPENDPGSPIETETELVERASQAVSQCRWVVGECAAQWTERYSRGRTDADFAVLIGISGDQVYQRRRVWETFAPVRANYKLLKWSHFYAALNWDDATECLDWAEETRATIVEMRAWRRARRGEDLTADPLEEFTAEFGGTSIPLQAQVVVDPDSYEGSFDRDAARQGAAGGQPAAVLAGVPREVGGAGARPESEYAPYRATAGSRPPAEGAEDGRKPGESRVPPEPPTTEQLVKRMSAALERCAKVLSADFQREFRDLPEPLQQRFLNAAQILAERVAELESA